MAKCLKCYRATSGADFHPACARRMFGVSSPPKLATTEAEVESYAHIFIKQRIAVTGVQRKLSLHWDATGSDRLTIVGALGGNYILKPPSAEYSQLPENEDLTMSVAQILGIRTAEHCLIRMADQKIAYLTRRFDRQDSKKIAIEDMCQLSETMTENKYRGSHELIAKIIRDYSTIPGDDLLRYYELVLFCFITGNADMHLKNFSMIQQASDFSLSPAYDLLSTRLVLSAREDPEELALSLNGKKSKLKARDFIAFAASLKIPTKVQQYTLRRYKTALPKIRTLIESSWLTPANQALYWQLLESRLQRLDDEASS